MNLRDFIRETLTEIADGVAEADEKVAARGGAVNPRNVVTNKSGEGPYGFCIEDRKAKYHPAVESIEFDVVVSAAEGKETKGGIGVHVGAIGIGSAGKSDQASSSQSRIKFRIPMLLPSSKNA
jgi:hypothetical protein